MFKPSELYKSYSKIDNIEQIATFELFEKYLKLNLRKQQKLTEIESTDLETILTKIDGGKPIPGHIYTFIYKGGPTSILDLKKEYNFIDKTPIVFCLYSDNEKMYGINFNLLPNKVRLAFLEAYYNMFEDYMKKADTLAQNNKISINKKFIDISKSRESTKIIKIFNKITKQNFNFAYRQYDYNKIINFRILEYNEWKYIPFYKPSNAILDMNFELIYKLYYKFLSVKKF